MVLPPKKTHQNGEQEIEPKKREISAWLPILLMENSIIEHGNLIISVLKENSVSTFVESIPFDTSHVVTQMLKVTAFMKTMVSGSASSIIVIPKQENFTAL